MTDGGKGSKRRREDTAQVEANWPTNWSARDVPTVPSTEGQGEAATPEEAQ